MNNTTRLHTALSRFAREIDELAYRDRGPKTLKTLARLTAAVETLAASVEAAAERLQLPSEPVRLRLVRK